MILLLSGEGPTDIGLSQRGGPCWGNEFQPGPMALLIEQLLEPCLDCRIFEYATEHDESWVYFVDENSLGQKARQIKNPKSQLLTGTESKTGTLFHRKEAYALALLAQEIESAKEDRVLAVLFRDSDGTQSQNDWQAKRDSILKGFENADFAGGAAMIPKPKSEAWLLCALRNNYLHCDSLENESGNDNSPNSLKKQLDDHLGCAATRESLNNLIRDGKIVARRIQMPSFQAFLESFINAARYANVDISPLQ